jgi:hypothetical protein
MRVGSAAAGGANSNDARSSATTRGITSAVRPAASAIEGPGGHATVDLVFADRHVEVLVGALGVLREGELDAFDIAVVAILLEAGRSALLVDQAEDHLALGIEEHAGLAAAGRPQHHRVVGLALDGGLAHVLHQRGLVEVAQQDQVVIAPEPFAQLGRLLGLEILHLRLVQRLEHGLGS